MFVRGAHTRLPSMNDLRAITTKANIRLKLKLQYDFTTQKENKIAINLSHSIRGTKFWLTLERFDLTLSVGHLPLARYLSTQTRTVGKRAYPNNEPQCDVYNVNNVRAILPKWHLVLP